MRTPPWRLCIPIALLALVTASCSGGDDPTPNSSGGAPLPIGTNDIPVPFGTNDAPLPLPLVSSDAPEPADAQNQFSIEVVVGVDADPARLETVPLGANVTMSISDPTSDNEFHLHGYELGGGVDVPAGQIETFTFVADQPGQFALESHESGDILMVLSVA